MSTWHLSLTDEKHEVACSGVGRGLWCSTLQPARPARAARQLHGRDGTREARGLLSVLRVLVLPYMYIYPGHPASAPAASAPAAKSRGCAHQADERMMNDLDTFLDLVPLCLLFQIFQRAFVGQEEGRRSCG